MPSITLSAIAAKVGYSKNTVSLALRGDPQIPETTRELIRRTADELGYRPNPVVSHLMAQLRFSQTARFQAKLALVNAHRHPDALRQHPTISAYAAGCKARGEKLGYNFDEFWLHDTHLRAESWIRILQTRGIKGIIIVGLTDQNRLPPPLQPVWACFPTIVTGVRTREPALSFCATDHHNLTILAFEKALQLGYQRPALVMEQRIDQLVEGRFSGAMLAAQQALPRERQIPAFMQVDEARGNPVLFHQWFKKHRPDVLLTLYNITADWLKLLKLRVPRDVGLIQLEWRPDRPDIAGMDQHNRLVGEAAVDMVVSQIHHGESGIPAFPRATLMGASWVDGASVTAERAKPTAPRRHSGR